ncbi:damage-inducible protein DinB [Pedobacter sp. PAMC26386]|nr:damage-inducible protein DinB [Pedobacter sp. PAMC26386]
MLQEKSITETVESSLVVLMKNYVNYNLWANTTLVNWLKTKTEDLIEQMIPSSFPSIKLTLVHINATENYWLSILNKSKYEMIDKANEPLEDIYGDFLKSSAALADFVNTMEMGDLQGNTLIISPWFQCDLQNFDYIMQVANHSTYHRGQIVTIGRNLGFTDAPMTDYNFYNVHGK